MPSALPACPLCTSTDVVALLSESRRDFLRCTSCLLTFIPPEQRPTPLAETLRYLQHHNRIDDPGHRVFLKSLVEPLANRLSPGAAGLDFGSGPAPVLAAMLRERGFTTHIYDPCFAPDQAALEGRYDFVTCTEVLEHIHEPRRVLGLISTLLRPGGCFAVMTGMLRDDAEFSRWWYRRDITHVCFFRPETMSWIADWQRWSAEAVAPDVTLFRA